MSVRNPLPPWGRRDNFSVIAHQRQTDAINAVASLFGSGTIGVAATPHGRTLIDGRTVEVTGLLFGEVTATGPLGTELDFPGDDRRRWVKLKRPTVEYQKRDGTLPVDEEDDDPTYPLASIADDLAPPGDHTVYEEGEDPEPPLIVVASDVGLVSDPPTAGEDVILLEAYARDADGGRTKCYLLIGQVQETFWGWVHTWDAATASYGVQEVRPAELEDRAVDNWVNPPDYRILDPNSGTGAIDPNQPLLDEGEDAERLIELDRFYLLRRTERLTLPENEGDPPGRETRWAIVNGAGTTGGAGGTLIEITDTYASVGYYVAKVVATPTADIDPDLLPDIEAGAGTGDDVIAINYNEAGSAEHWIDPAGNQRTFIAVLIYTNSDGTAVYAFNGFITEVCT